MINQRLSRPYLKALKKVVLFLTNLYDSPNNLDSLLAILQLSPQLEHITFGVSRSLEFERMNSVHKQKVMQRERMLKDSNIPYTLVYFHQLFENIPFLIGDEITTTRTFAWVKEGFGLPIARQDLAEVVLNVVTNSAQYTGRRLTITGDEYLSGEDIAEVISEAVGEQIIFTEIRSKPFIKIQIQKKSSSKQFAREAVLPSMLVHPDSSNRSKEVVAIIGRPLQKFRQWVAENSHLFLPQGLPLV